MPNFNSTKVGFKVAILPSLVVYLLSSSIMAGAIIFIALTYYFYKYSERHKDRKEPLKILLENNKLHFLLSNDDFLEVPLQKDQNIAEVIISTVKKEMATIKQMVERIYLVNIKDEKLENQLNSMIARQ